MESGDPATAAGLLLLDLVEQQQARNAHQMPNEFYNMLTNRQLHSFHPIYHLTQIL